MFIQCVQFITMGVWITFVLPQVEMLCENAIEESMCDLTGSPCFSYGWKRHQPVRKDLVQLQIENTPAILYNQNTANACHTFQNVSVIVALAKKHLWLVWHHQILHIWIAFNRPPNVSINILGWFILFIYKQTVTKHLHFNEYWQNLYCSCRSCRTSERCIFRD